MCPSSVLSGHHLLPSASDVYFECSLRYCLLKTELQNDLFVIAGKHWKFLRYHRRYWMDTLPTWTNLQIPFAFYKTYNNVFSLAYIFLYQEYHSTNFCLFLLKHCWLLQPSDWFFLKTNSSLWRKIDTEITLFIVCKFAKQHSLTSVIITIFILSAFHSPSLCYAPYWKYDIPSLHILH